MENNNNQQYDTKNMDHIPGENEGRKRKLGGGMKGIPIIYNEIDEVIDKDKIITNKYNNFSPTNFYFEVPNEITDFELLNNDDLNVFLSLLN